MRGCGAPQLDARISFFTILPLACPSSCQRRSKPPFGSPVSCLSRPLSRLLATYTQTQTAWRCGAWWLGAALQRTCEGFGYDVNRARAADHALPVLLCSGQSLSSGHMESRERCIRPSDRISTENHDWKAAEGLSNQSWTGLGRRRLPASLLSKPPRPRSISNRLTPTPTAAPTHQTTNRPPSSLL